MKTKFCSASRCRRSGQRLRASEFPRNRRMKSGLHPYCKECARMLQRESRARNRHLLIARKAMTLAKADPVRNVFNAIRRGHRTRLQIRRSTILNYDQISDALAELVFECGAIRTYRVDGEAVFILSDQVRKA